MCVTAFLHIKAGQLDFVRKILLFVCLFLWTPSGKNTARKLLHTKTTQLYFEQHVLLRLFQFLEHKGYALPIYLSKMMMAVHQIQPLIATNFLNGVLVSYKLSLDDLIARGEIKTQP